MNRGDGLGLLAPVPAIKLSEPKLSDGQVGAVFQEMRSIRPVGEKFGQAEKRRAGIVQ